MNKPLFLIMALCCLPLTVAATLDEERLNRRDSLDLPLRWDELPLSAPAARLDEGQWLRLQANRPLLAEEVQVEVGNGSGLWQTVFISKNGDGPTLLLPPLMTPGWECRIRRLHQQGDPLSLRLFASRVEDSGPLTHYRQEMIPPGPTAHVRPYRQGAPLSYAKLAGGEQRTLTVQGPLRLSLAMLTLYQSGEGERILQGWLDVLLDGQSWHHREITNNPEVAQPIFVDGVATPVSQQETFFVDIPAGEHRLDVVSTLPILLRPLAEGEDEYLLPQWNRTPKNPPARRSEIGNGSAWEITPATLGHLARQASLYQVEQAAQRIQRDNRHGEGGTVAFAWMQKSVEKRQDTPLLLKEGVLPQNGLFYQSLFPVTPQHQGELQVRRFIPRTLPGLITKEKGTVLFADHLGQTLQGMGEGWFFRLSQSVTSFVLPNRSQPSFLRILVDRQSASAGQLMVSMDGGPPIPLTLDNTPPLLENPTQLDAAQIALWQKSGHWDTLSGPFSRFGQSAPTTQVGFIDLPLPAGIKEVALWQPQANGLAVGVQIAMAKPWTMTERAWLTLANQQNAWLFFNRLLQGGEAVTAVEHDLASHWQPLLRFLQGEYRLFFAAIPPISQAGDIQAPHQGVHLARQAMASKQWVQAVRHWSDLLRQGATPWRQEALLARTQAMALAGEDYLAERHWRSIMLHDKDETLRQQAFQALRQWIDLSKDVDRAISLHAAWFYARRDPTLLPPLISLLVEKGILDHALALGLLLPEEQRPVQPMLTASLALGWQQVFNALKATLSDPQQQAYWSGQQALDQLDVAKAEQALQQADSLGKPLLQQIRDEKKVGQLLASGEKEAGIKLWSQLSPPGPYTWKAEPEWIQSHAGARQLYAVEKDLTTHSFLAAATIEVAGPLTIKIEARPLHDSRDPSPKDGWLLLRDEDGLDVQAMLDNTPTPGLQMVGNSRLVPGTASEIIRTLGPGLHRLQVSGEGFPLLFRLLVQRPILPVAFLPVLSVNGLARLLSPPPPPVVEPGWFGWGRHMAILSGGGEPLTIPFQGELPASLSAPAWRQAQEGLIHLKKSSANFARQWLSQNRFQEIFADTSWQDATRRMNQLLWVASKKPALAEQAMIAAKEMINSQPPTPGLTGLLNRIMATLNWETLQNVEESAGIRTFPLDRWQPEPSALALRGSLFKGLQEGEQVLFAFERLTLAINRTTATTLTVHLWPEDLAPFPPQDVGVVWQWDSEKPSRRRLSAPTVVTIPVSAGNHQLTFALEKPLANQFLRLRLAEKGQTIALPMERSWHVANRETPLRMAIPSPAWLQIDEYRQGEIISQERKNVGGSLILSPAPGQQEGYFRVHRLSASPIPPHPTPPRLSAQPPQPVGQPLLTITREESTPSLQDYYELGKQQEGTPSLGVAWQQKNRNGGESTGKGSDRFIQLSGQYRYDDQEERNWYRGEMLLRLRSSGDPTLGINGMIRHQPYYWPFAWTLQGELWSQLGDQTAWSGQLRGTLLQQRDISPTLWHTPAVGGLQRFVSADKPDTLDQDVASTYKQQHHNGLFLADTLTWQPWLDTLFHAGGQWNSNPLDQSFTSEKLSLTVGGEVMLGDWLAGGQVERSHYFQDDDRRASVNYDRLNLHVSSDWWDGNQHRWETRAEVNQLAAGRGWSTLLSLSRHLGEGRGLKDFANWETPFRELRLPRSFDANNNRMVEHGP